MIRDSFIGGEPCLKLTGVVLAEAGRNERAGLGRANGLAGTGLRKDDMPKVRVRNRKGDAHKPAIMFFPQRSDMAVDRFGGHLIENVNPLTREQGRVHQKKSAVSADNIRGSFQVDGLPFR